MLIRVKANGIAVKLNTSTWRSLERNMRANQNIEVSITEGLPAKVRFRTSGDVEIVESKDKANETRFRATDSARKNKQGSGEIKVFEGRRIVFRIKVNITDSEEESKPSKESKTVTIPIPFLR